MMLRSVLSLLLLAGAPPSFAQTYLADLHQFEVVDGLSHREVFTTHQDRQGFIWLGTKQGLNRFDGRQFRVWSAEEHGLSSNEHHFLFEDDQGLLWAFHTEHWHYQANPRSIDLIDTRGNSAWTLSSYFTDQVPFQPEQIAGFIGSPKGRLFFTLKDGRLFRYEAGTFTLFQLPFSQPFYLKALGPESTLWGYTGPDVEKPKRLYQISSSGAIQKEWELPEDTRALNICIDAETSQVRAFIFSTSAGGEYYRISPDGQFVKTGPGQFPEVLATIFPTWDRQVLQSPKGPHFWLKGRERLIVLDDQGKTVFDPGTAFPELLKADIHRIYFDASGGVWLAAAKGLYLLQLKPNRFQQYLYAKEQKNQAQSSYSCRGIYAEERQLWVNTYGGRQGVDLNTGNAETLSFLPYKSNKGVNTLTGYNPLSMLKGEGDELWFGDFSLIRRTLKTGEEKLFRWPLDLGHEPEIWSLFQDANGKIWLGTNQGIGYLNPDTEGLEIAHVLNEKADLRTSTIYSFVASKSGVVWITADKGLYRWMPDKGQLNRWCTACPENRYIPNETVFHVHEDAAGLLWLATAGGLIQLDPGAQTANKHYRQYTTADGLSNNKLYAVYEDDQANLWMSSDYGLIAFNKSSGQARAYLPGDGTTHFEFNRISHFQAEDGRLFFGGLNGVTALDPADFYQDQTTLEADLRITRFQQFDGKRNEFVDRTSELQETPSIRLKPQDRFFRIEFALLDFADPAQHRFAWLLEDIDQDWNYSKASFIRVSGLAAGNYTLRIKGQTVDGRWSDEIRLKVQVQEPFYRKGWFWGLLLLLSTILALYAYRRRIQQLSKRQEALEALVRSRTQTIEQQAEELRQLDTLKSRFFTNVSHELRTPLSLMLGPIDSALQCRQLDHKSHTYLQLARQNGQQLLKLVNEILDLAKLEAREMQLKEQPVVLYPLLRRIAAGFESWAENHQKLFEFQYRPDRYLKIQLDSDKLEKILTNLLANAFKFTEPGDRVTLLVEELPNKLRIQVIDTGRGMREADLPHIFNRFYQTKHPEQAEEGGTGIGLALCAEFAKLMKGSLRAESTWQEGSTFSFEFPKIEVLGTSTAETLTGTELPHALPVIPAAQASVEAPRPRILLVEDHQQLSAYIRMILQAHYTVFACRHGAAALEQLEAWRAEGQSVDLILSDIMMPVMDGFQLLEKLKGSDAFRSIPVILLTARADLQGRLKALRIGVDDYLVKPFIESELLARIENLVKRFAQQPADGPQWTRPEISLADQEWLAEQEELLKENLSNTDFSVSFWAASVALSERQLQRKIKLLTQLSPLQYLQENRLHPARQLLETGRYYSVSEVAQAVGFSVPATFSRNFKKRFGKSPSDYL
ncbi:MAG: response regulator [Phaeodactylibacter sp.]|nr:response regulator [Phaeodactylibacter sp.]